MAHSPDVKCINSFVRQTPTFVVLIAPMENP